MGGVAPGVSELSASDATRKVPLRKRTATVSMGRNPTTSPISSIATRSADLVAMDEMGEVVGLRPMDTVAVRFRRGTFLVASEALSSETPGATPPTPNADS